MARLVYDGFGLKALINHRCGTLVLHVPFSPTSKLIIYLSMVGGLEHIVFECLGIELCGAGHVLRGRGEVEEQEGEA